MIPCHLTPSLCNDHLKQQAAQCPALQPQYPHTTMCQAPCPFILSCTCVTGSLDKPTCLCLLCHNALHLMDIVYAFQYTVVVCTGCSKLDSSCPKVD
jgi:hypothetical protein